MQYDNRPYAMYLRKSREDVEMEKYGEGETLARHEQLLTDFAKRRNLEIGEIYREVVSGETISERKQMQRLLRDIETEKWAGVLVVEVERLARGDTADQGLVLKAFKYSQTKIVTPVKTYDPNNEYDEEYFEFGLFMSRREYKTINRRLQRGRELSVAEGKYVGNIAPFGYDRVKLDNTKGYTLVLNEQEASIVKEIFRLYSIEDLSMNDILKHLNFLELKPRLTDTWTISSIKDILHNPTYIGKVVWNRRKQVKKMKNGKLVTSRPRNGNYLIYDGLHQPIIDKSTWNLVQVKLKEHVPKLNHNSTMQNPLSGLIFCEKCGKPMQRRPYLKAGKPPTLICNNPTCDNISSNLSFVEDKLISALRIWLEDYKLNYKEQVITPHKNHSINLSINATKKALEKEQEKLNKIYSFLEDGVYNKTEFVSRVQVVKENIQKFEKRLADDTKLIEMPEQEEKLIIPQIENIIDLYHKLKTAEDKNTLLKSFLSKVTYLKTEKCIKKDADFSNFELHIYPKIPKNLPK